MKTSGWIIFAVCWGLINLFAPQIYVDKLVDVEGSHGLHPFHRWRLFTGTDKLTKRSGLEAVNCRPLPFNPLAETFRYPALRWRTKHRTNQIGWLFEAGHNEEARAALLKLSQRVLPDVVNEKCELQLYWYVHNGLGDKERIFVEGSRIAF